MTAHHAALAASIVVGVAGQLLLKAGAVGATDLWTQLLRPATIAGLGCYGVSALGYLVALQTIPVSVAFPSVAASYVAVALLGALLWSEPLHARQLAAIGLIVVGVALLHRG